MDCKGDRGRQGEQDGDTASVQEKVGMADPAWSEQNRQQWGRSYHWSSQERLCRARGAVMEQGGLASWLKPLCMLTETEEGWACTWKTSASLWPEGSLRERASELGEEVLWVRGTRHSSNG